MINEILLPYQFFFEPRLFKLVFRYSWDNQFSLIQRTKKEIIVIMNFCPMILTEMTLIKFKYLKYSKCN